MREFRILHSSFYILHCDRQPWPKGHATRTTRQAATKTNSAGQDITYPRCDRNPDSEFTLSKNN